MTEADIEIILQAAKEKYAEARPRIIADNGPQFIAKDFKEFIRISGMTHVRTSPYYPQSRKDRTLGQIAQRRVHPAGNATVAGRCAASGGGLCRALQQRSPEQRGWVHHPAGHARWASTGDPRREGPEVGGGAKAAADSSAAGCVIGFGATVRDARSARMN
jgi:hypothetical protein